MYTYTKVGGEGGALPTSPYPLNTCSHNTATRTRRPPHPSNTQQHTTTHNNRQQHTTTVHNSTRVHKTTNVPVVFMALILNGFEECNIITGTLIVKMGIAQGTEGIRSGAGEYKE
jgi:hypothetical protein